jgi:Icc protein
VTAPAVCATLASPMRVLDLDLEPTTELRYLNAKSGGGTIVERLPLIHGRVDRLPEGLEALVLASDLQGTMPSPRGGPSLLAGEALAEYIACWSDAGELPPLGAIGVVLAGDLYSSPAADERGATGDVLPVWEGFAALGCPLVVGVAGNHDVFADEKAFARLCADADGEIALLDGTVHEHGGLRFGGVGYIIGNPAKRGRRSEDEFFERLESVMRAAPDVVVLHQGPDGEERSQRGDTAVRQALIDGEVPLAVCGHVGWKAPLSRLGERGQVLNVDGRVVVLQTAASASRG